MRAGSVVPHQPAVASELADTRGDRPWQHRTAGKSDAVVVDRDSDGIALRHRANRAKASAGVTARVPDRLENDLEYVLHHQSRCLEVGVHRETRLACDDGGM